MAGMNSFGNFSEEPDTDFGKKRNLNYLKESISKLSTDFKNNSMFFQSMVASSSKKRNGPQFFGNAMRSMDVAGGMDSTLPNIHGGSQPPKRLPVKSPVMESIRMSRQTRKYNIMSAGRNRDDSPGYDSDSDQSNISKVTNMRK